MMHKGLPIPGADSEDAGVQSAEKFLERIAEGSDRHASAVLDSFGFGAPPEALIPRTRRDVISSQILGYEKKDQEVIISQEEIDQAKAEFSKRTGWRSEHDHHPA